MTSMLKKLTQFLRDAGKLGVASEIGAVILYLVALWEHTQDRTVSFYLFMCVSVLLFWLGAFLAWSKQHSEVEIMRSKLAAIPKIKLAREAFAVKLKEFIHIRDDQAFCNKRSPQHGSNSAKNNASRESQTCQPFLCY
jgi:hypothetical protein